MIKRAESADKRSVMRSGDMLSLNGKQWRTKLANLDI